MKPIADADLILNPDGSIYHLNLLPEDIAGTVITVGDPERVPVVSAHFDRIELRKGKREFLTHTGYVGNTRISVLSTGIGTDNIDIVLNELDALVNIDLDARLPKQQLTSLTLIRIGTSGAIQPDITPGDLLISSFGLGFDALIRYYSYPPLQAEQRLLEAVDLYFDTIPGTRPYLAQANNDLMQRFGKGLQKGITVTAPGFYAPQGRRLRLQNTMPDFIGHLQKFNSADQRLTNLEMETAGIYALAGCMGHKAISVNAILANRITGEFSKKPEAVVRQAICRVLEGL